MTVFSKMCGNIENSKQFNYPESPPVLYYSMTGTLKKIIQPLYYIIPKPMDRAYLQKVNKFRAAGVPSMDFGRPSSDFRRSPEFAARRDLRLDPQQHRSRSQNRVDPEFIPADHSPYNRPIDKNSRSKSLDYRDAFRDDDPYFGDRGGRGVTIPIRQERAEDRRNYDYDREYDQRRWVDTPRGREIEIPTERIRAARSSDYLDRLDRRQQYDDRRGRTERQSPKSISSGKKNKGLDLSFDAARSRRVEPPPIEYRRDASRQDYRDYGDRREAARGGGGGHSRYESSYQYETHGGAGGMGGMGRGGISPRRITQQPQPGQALSPPNYGAPGGGPNGYGPRPVQYRKIRCCCFTFIWPPWSNEPTVPPQPIYRNI